MRRDSSFCAESVKYNIFTNDAPYAYRILFESLRSALCMHACKRIHCRHTAGVASSLQWCWCFLFFALSCLPLFRCLFWTAVTGPLFQLWLPFQSKPHFFLSVNSWGVVARFLTATILAHSVSTVPFAAVCSLPCSCLWRCCRFTACALPGDSF